jgi:predicted SnoaL-like aldol condensation-catalyzing enzyme
MPAKVKKSPAKKSKLAAARTPVRRAAPSRRTGSVENNKTLVRRLLEHGLTESSRTDPETLHAYFADDFVDHVPIHHEKPGVHGVKEVMGELHEGTRAFRMQVAHVVAEGDWVAVHWEASADRHSTLQKHRQLKNIEPGGARTAAGITLFRLKGGKIVESWNYDNALELAMQSRSAATP